jgi:hypothetical protein
LLVIVAVPASLVPKLSLMRVLIALGKGTVSAAAAGAAVATVPATAPALTNPATTAVDVTADKSFLNMVVPPVFSPVHAGNRCDCPIKDWIEECKAP